MATEKSFEEHVFRIEFDCGSFRMQAKDPCPEPYHNPECAYMKFVDTQLENKAHVRISDDIGIRYLGSINMFDAPPCDCGTYERSWCHWCHDDITSELLSGTLEVKGDYHYTYDAYHNESEAWITLKEVKIID